MITILLECRECMQRVIRKDAYLVRVMLTKMKCSSHQTSGPCLLSNLPVSNCELVQVHELCILSIRANCLRSCKFYIFCTMKPESNQVLVNGVLFAQIVAISSADGESARPIFADHLILVLMFGFLTDAP